MNSHVSSILLGVNDMERSKRFYTEGLGWKVQNDYQISVFFVPHGGSLVGFYGRDGLANMAISEVVVDLPGQPGCVGLPVLCGPQVPFRAVVGHGADHEQHLVNQACRSRLPTPPHPGSGPQNRRHPRLWCRYHCRPAVPAHHRPQPFRCAARRRS
jgi:catechol 2,3-dioxygenase-like lactoylglutathione lyase family enzyme